MVRIVFTFDLYVRYLRPVVLLFFTDFLLLFTLEIYIIHYQAISFCKASHFINYYDLLNLLVLTMYKVHDYMKQMFI